MYTYGRLLICVVAVLTTAASAWAQIPLAGRFGKEAEAPGPAPGPVVPGFGNEFEDRPVPGFGSQEDATEESPDASSSIVRRRRATIRPSPAALMLRSLRTAHDRSADKPVARRFHTAAELLPEGLPDWFRTRDANGDGQIAMAEYAKDWSDAKVREYQQWDLNNDGVIEPSEALKVLGIDRSRQAKRPAKPARALPTTSAPVAVRSAEAIQARNERREDSLVLSFLARYDRDGSGALEQAEWADLPWQNPRRWDANRDARLTNDEIAAQFAGSRRP